MAEEQPVICIDTNLLIYAHRGGTPEHGAAQAAIESAAARRRGWGFSLPSICEFWAQVTHPRCPGGPSSAVQAARFLESLIESGGARVFGPGPGFPRLLVETTLELGISGVRVFDVQIGLMAIAGGATRLWTHDASFVALPGLLIEDPLS
jgi:predicted nucleic acid-binding protein